MTLLDHPRIVLSVLGFVILAMFLAILWLPGGER